MERPNDERLDIEAPNESAPGHELPDPPPLGGRQREDRPEAPNESAPGHHPDPGDEA